LHAIHARATRLTSECSRALPAEGGRPPAPLRKFGGADKRPVRCRPAALAQADLGIAIGAGIDVAIQTTDVVLMRSDPLHVPTPFAIGRGTLQDMRENLGWRAATTP
jgi:hypothetical protein